MIELAGPRSVDPQALRSGVQPLRACGRELAMPSPSLPCRIWRGSHTAHGYGQCWSGGRNWAVHRLAWIEANGPIPPRMCVCHHCDTPACYEITHLFLGTPADNAHDRDAKGRHVPVHLRGEENGNVKLTRAQVDEIRATVRPMPGMGRGRRGGISAAARRYGVSPSTIGNVLAGRTWL
jgi:hypothetical protein